MDETQANQLLRDEGRYLPLFQYLRDRYADPLDLRAQSSLGEVQAMLGDEAAAFRTMRPCLAQMRPGAEDRSGAHATDALDAIAAAARGRRLVILNESHHDSRSRAFALQLAQVLRREGFTHFAAEAFGPSLALSAVTTATGYYISDPMFASLVREARDHWSGAFAYEADFRQAPKQDYPAEIGWREAQQAEALARVMNDDPSARLFVYCGYGHAEKVALGDTPMMAARLWAMTGVEPLTIAQSFGAPAPDPECSWPGLEPALAAFPFETSFVLLDAAGLSFSPMRPWAPEPYDFTVRHPRLPDDNGRPGWLARLPGRRRIAVAVPPGEGMRLIQAVPSAELAQAANAVPADQVLVEDGRREVDLWLPAGTYDLRVETLAGRTVLNRVTV